MALIAVIIAVGAFYYSKTRGIPEQFIVKTQGSDSKNSVNSAAGGQNTVNVSTVPETQEPTISTALKGFTDPNIGSTEYYPVTNSKGTVILIPQQHQNPGSEAADRSNDLAETTQIQIHGILKSLNLNLGINLVLAEGEMYGPVPDNKIRYISKLINLKNKLSGQIIKLKSNSTPDILGLEKGLVNDLDYYLSSLDREIALLGAPYRLKAEGKNITLYGIENQDTYDKSADLVRNLVYLEDRENQLAPSQPIALSNGNGLSSAFPISMPQQSPSQVLERDFSLLNMVNEFPLLPGNSALSDLQNTFNEIEALKKNNSAPTSALPSRTDNPYKNISDPGKISSLLQQTNNDIQKTIIDQRNLDTAQNSLKALNDNKNTSLILLLGAGHKDGVVKDLNRLGLSVLVLTPKAIS